MASADIVMNLAFVEKATQRLKGSLLCCALQGMPWSLVQRRDGTTHDELLDAQRMGDELARRLDGDTRVLFQTYWNGQRIADAVLDPVVEDGAPPPAFQVMHVMTQYALGNVRGLPHQHHSPSVW